MVRPPTIFFFGSRLPWLLLVFCASVQILFFLCKERSWYFEWGAQICTLLLVVWLFSEHQPCQPMSPGCLSILWYTTQFLQCLKVTMLERSFISLVRLVPRMGFGLYFVLVCVSVCVDSDCFLNFFSMFVCLSYVQKKTTDYYVLIFIL